MKKSHPETSDLLGRMAEEALRLAVYEAVKDHARTGDPVVIWKNGKVVSVPARRLKMKKPRLRYKPQ